MWVRLLCEEDIKPMRGRREMYLTEGEWKRAGGWGGGEGAGRAGRRGQEACHPGPSPVPAGMMAPKGSSRPFRLTDAPLLLLGSGGSCPAFWILPRFKEIRLEMSHYVIRGQAGITGNRLPDRNHGPEPCRGQWVACSRHQNVCILTPPCSPSSI